MACEVYGPSTILLNDTCTQLFHIYEGGYQEHIHIYWYYRLTRQR